MKSLILFITLMCCSYMALAQDSVSSKHSFRLLVSGSSPTGEFNRTEFEDAYPDFAQEGTLLTAGYLRKLNRFVSVGPSVHYRIHKYDLDKFAGSKDELVLQREAEPWKSWFTMADLYLNSRNNGAGFFFLKGSAGASFNKSAQVNVSTVFGNIDLPSDQATSFAWEVGAGVQGDFSSWGIRIECSQLSTTPTFMGKDPNGNTMEYKQPMNTLNLGIGISYNF